MTAAPRVLSLVLSGKAPALSALRYVLLQRYGLPELLVHAPRTWARLVHALAGRVVGPVYAFTSGDLWARSYYAKLARNLREVGRVGYVWDEGLGIPMGPRFYQNSATYAVYGALSCRAFSLVCAGGFLASVLAAGVALGHAGFSLALGVLLVGSPAFISAFVAHSIKPEIVWWPLAVPALVAAYEGAWPVAWAILGFLLVVNASVGVIVGGLLAAPAAWSLVTTGWPGGPWILCVVAGAAKLAVRMVPAVRSGLLGAVGNAQAQFVERSRPPISLEYVALGVAGPVLLAGWGRWDAAIASAAVVTGLYWVNLRRIKFADTVVMQVILLTSAVAAALVAHDWRGIAGVVLIAYTGPLALAPGGDRATPTAGDVRARIARMRAALRDFPWLTPMRSPRPPALIRFFDHVPAGSRLVMEADAEARTSSPYLRFRDWTNEFLPARQVEFVNHTFWPGLAEPALAARYLDRFTVRELEPKVMHDACCALGVGFVIASSAETAAALKQLGYEERARVTGAEYHDFAGLARMPAADLVLLENPEGAGVVAPAVAWTRSGNAMAWDARAGEAYTLRYRFDARFRASQDALALTVEPEPVFSDVPLRFMRVRAARDGRLTVRYEGRWW